MSNKNKYKDSDIPDMEPTYQIIRQPSKINYSSAQLSQTQMCAICDKQGQLGRIDARLDNQEQADKRIAASVQQLLDTFTEQKKQSIRQFGKIGSQISKLNVIMENSVGKTDEMIKAQSSILSQLSQLSTSHNVLKVQQQQTQKAVKDLNRTVQGEIACRGTEHNSIYDRIEKIEKKNYAWYAVGIIIVTILAALASLAQFLQLFKK